ncbi:hypothetical protein [Acetobacter persici]|uniref:hypothetical protein n=1 Tax=Acetobacter persici TaxID=1076596 RepID=UPI001BA674E4|nr:hypothetical protein [Acetobacter persici]MBS0963284.1 hypothetical protein [Acetobacter persici]
MPSTFLSVAGVILYFKNLLACLPKTGRRFIAPKRKPLKTPRFLHDISEENGGYFYQVGAGPLTI